MILGTLTRKDTLYGGEGYGVTGNGDLAGQLKDAVSRLPRFAPSNVVPIAESPAFTPPPPLNLSEGSFFVDDNRVICQITNGQSVPVDYQGTTLTPAAP